MKLTKSKLKQLIKETIQENEGRYWDPEVTYEERAKDELQTAMLDGAQAYLEKHFAGIRNEKLRRSTIDEYNHELETMLVDAMMDWGMPSVEFVNDYWGSIDDTTL